LIEKVFEKFPQIKYLMGANITIADLHIYFMMNAWYTYDRNFDQWPKVKAWMELMHADPVIAEIDAYTLKAVEGMYAAIKALNEKK